MRFLAKCCFYKGVPRKNLIQTKNGLPMRFFGGGCIYEIVPEQKARATYDNILRLSDDSDVNDVIRFLRQREITHFQRFGEALNKLQSKLEHKKVYANGIKKDCRCDKDENNK